MSTPRRQAGSVSPSSSFVNYLPLEITQDPMLHIGVVGRIGVIGFEDQHDLLVRELEKPGCGEAAGLLTDMVFQDMHAAHEHFMLTGTWPSDEPSASW